MHTRYLVRAVTSHIFVSRELKTCYLFHLYTSRTMKQSGIPPGRASAHRNLHWLPEVLNNGKPLFSVLDMTCRLLSPSYIRCRRRHIVSRFRLPSVRQWISSDVRCSQPARKHLQITPHITLPSCQIMFEGAVIDVLRCMVPASSASVTVPHLNIGQRGCGVVNDPRSSLLDELPPRGFVEAWPLRA